MSSAITFDKMTTFEGAQECFMVVEGKFVGWLRRERPMVMGVHFRDIIDTSKPWMYTVEVGDLTLDIADGTNLRAVKKAMIEAYNATNG